MHEDTQIFFGEFFHKPDLSIAASSHHGQIPAISSLVSLNKPAWFKISEGLAKCILTLFFCSMDRALFQDIQEAESLITLQGWCHFQTCPIVDVRKPEFINDFMENLQRFKVV